MGNRMNTVVRLGLLIAGGLSLASLVLWAFTGVALWAPVGDSWARGMALYVLHSAGLIGGFIALMESDGGTA